MSEGVDSIEFDKMILTHFELLKLEFILQI